MELRPVSFPIYLPSVTCGGQTVWQQGPDWTFVPERIRLSRAHSAPWFRLDVKVGEDFSFEGLAGDLAWDAPLPFVKVHRGAPLRIWFHNIDCQNRPVLAVVVGQRVVG